MSSSGSDKKHGSKYVSWGQHMRSDAQMLRLASRNDSLPLPDEAAMPVLPYGQGRSYGDSCMNNGGALISNASLNHFIEFDYQTGRLSCEAGVTLAEILDLVVPQGWFLPVTPGTRFVSIGGAIANDVHGKNHHRAGTFGCHVLSFELLRSDGTRMQCSADENPDWFAATIGGLGLTGMITRAELQLKAVMNPYLQEETIRFNNVDEFFAINSESEDQFEYTVAWIDCVAKGDSLGRGAYYRANHHGSASPHKQPAAPKGNFSFPFTPPLSLVNKLSLKAFNEIYYRLQPERRNRTVHYQPFFYPLDSIQHWNRMYGPSGMLQYQCVVPHEEGQQVMKDLLKTIADSGDGSFLVVLKTFGDVASPGLLSFPQPGVTLALDFPNKPAVLPLLNRLDDITREAGGRLYPAKDARMSAADFQAGYPQWQAFKEFIDPRFSSGFWRRVTATV